MGAGRRPVRDSDRSDIGRPFASFQVGFSKPTSATAPCGCSQCWRFMRIALHGRRSHGVRVLPRQ